MTEIGRQPWLVTGVLTTAESVADVSGGMVLSTLLAYLAVYALLTAAYLGALTYLARKASHGGRTTPDPAPRDAGVEIMTPAE